MLARWLVFALVLGFPAAAQAEEDLQTLLDSKNWKFADETADPQIGLPSCRAYTTASNSTLPLELSLHFPKDNKALPFATVRTGAGAPSALLSVKMSTRESHYFFRWKEGATNEEANTFWYVPLDFPGLVSLVRAKDQLELTLDPKGAKTAVKVSLAGSSAVMGEVKKCLGKAASADSFFALLQKEKETLTPDLGDRSVDKLFQATQAAYQAYLAGNEWQPKLDALKKTFRKELAAETAAADAFKTAKTRADQAATKLEQEQAKGAQLEARIAAAQSELEQLKQQKSAADQDLAQKEGVYKPLREQMRPYESRVSAARDRLANANAQISRNEAAIRDGEAAIQSLQWEMSNVQSRISSLQSELSGLRSDLSRAESEYNRYDVHREARRILENDWQFRNLVQQLQQKRHESEQARRDAGDAERRAQDLQGQLSRCQATPGQDCSSLQAQLSQAQSEAQSKRWRVSQLENECRSIENQMQWRENDARRQAESEESRLRSIRDRLAGEVRERESELSQKQSRLSQIQFEILDTKGEVDRARNALPGLRRERDRAGTELAEARAARDAFAQQIGFEAAKKAYEEAVDAVEKIAKSVSTKVAEISQLQKQLAASKKEAEALAKDLTKKRAEQEAAGQKLVLAQAKAKPYHDQAAPIEAELDAIATRFHESRAVYQQLYVYLADSLR